ncbi:MAG: DNA/RNA non-specific endonuclease [Acidobacteria bacterium]|nr:DNA/RNA non-specific endonuclease [Acidobacteriota bacterium]
MLLRLKHSTALARRESVGGGRHTVPDKGRSILRYSRRPPPSPRPPSPTAKTSLSCYDTANQRALWTPHQPKPSHAPSPRKPWRKDHALNSLSAAAFTNTGFDRGHLAPAADLPESSDTFLACSSPRVPTNWARVEGRGFHRRRLRQLRQPEHRSAMLPLQDRNPRKRSNPRRLRQKRATAPITGLESTTSSRRRKNRPHAKTRSQISKKYISFIINNLKNNPVKSLHRRAILRVRDGPLTHAAPKGHLLFIPRKE